MAAQEMIIFLWFLHFATFATQLVQPSYCKHSRNSALCSAARTLGCMRPIVAEEPQNSAKKPRKTQSAKNVKQLVGNHEYRSASSRNSFVKMLGPILYSHIKFGKISSMYTCSIHNNNNILKRK